jgi:VWFA-related protein
MSRLRTAFAVNAAIVALFAPHFLPAQAASTAQSPGGSPDTSIDTPVLRLEVRRVPVDIVVLDKFGNPVKGLTQGDFVVKEDGVVQRVTGFDAVDGSKDSYVPPKLPPLPANTFVNVPDTPERGPLYILYYDLVNTIPTDQMAFRRELLKFVDNAPAGTRIALFVSGKNLRMLQGFTTDHALLRAAIESKGPGPHIPDVFIYGDVYKKDDPGPVLSNFAWIAEYMSGIPGRKNLLWMSSDFPIPIGPELQGSAASAMAGAAPSPGATGSGGGPMLLDLSDLLKDMMKRTYSAMMKSQIALYPISVAGIDNPEDAFGEGDRAIDHERMEMIAQATGGHAYSGNNHVNELLGQAVTHGETYYALSYAPAKTNFDGSPRNINVELTKPCKYCTLTFRHLYYAIGDDNGDIDKQHKKDPVQARFLKEKAADTLYANMEHGAPMLHDLLFSTHLTAVGGSRMATEAEMLSLQNEAGYFKTRKPNKPVKPPAPVKLQKYRIDYGVIDVQLRRAVNAGATPTIEFAAAAYNSDGALLNSVVNQGTPSGNGATKTGVLFRAEQELEAPEGAAFIRLAVRDTMTNRTGTVEVALPLKNAGTRDKGTGF